MLLSITPNPLLRFPPSPSSASSTFLVQTRVRVCGFFSSKPVMDNSTVHEIEDSDLRAQQETGKEKVKQRDDGVIVQYVVLRRDPIDSWPLGSIVTQGCHASVCAIWEFKDDEYTAKYCASTNLDSMHKVTLEVKEESQILRLSEKLKSGGIAHKLWIEQPENIPTCLATKPYPKSTYKATAPSLWSFVLSAPDSNSWIAIGFSKMAGRMQGSSAVVGWPTTNGDGAIKQYYLNGYSRSSVLPDQGDLAIVNSALVQQFSMLYLAFQLKTTTPLSSLLFAVGPMDVIPDAGNFLDRHRSYTSVTLDFSAGNNTTSPAANGGSGESDDGNNSDGTSPGSESGSGSLQPGNSFREPAGGSRRSSVPSEGSSSLTTRRTHGIINIMTWILILPLGITAARHYKHHEPSWFYHHIALQMVGFGLVIGGIVTGMNLEDQSAGVDRHKALGFVALSLACCQVTALLVRPDKNSKFRRYWNWYHHWVGRSALLIGVINTFYGIKLARESRSWYEYVGIVLGIWGLSSIVLEVKKIYGARNDEHEFLQPASNDA